MRICVIWEQSKCIYRIYFAQFTLFEVNLESRICYQIVGDESQCYLRALGYDLTGNVASSQWYYIIWFAIIPQVYLRNTKIRNNGLIPNVKKIMSEMFSNGVFSFTKKCFLFLFLADHISIIYLSSKSKAKNINLTNSSLFAFISHSQNRLLK